MTIDAPIDAASPQVPAAFSVAGLLTAPILPTLLRLAIPNMIAMVGSTLVSPRRSAARSAAAIASAPQPWRCTPRSSAYAAVWPSCS
jgi:hypothetical protein